MLKSQVYDPCGIVDNNFFCGVKTEPHDYRDISSNLLAFNIKTTTFFVFAEPSR